MTSPHTNDHTPWAVFLIFLRLGLTSFGGPIAHLGYFRNEFVIQRQWLTERSYADLVGLCQFLPGPASSQVGMAIGLSRCGYAGALAAWAGFTLPSAIALFGFALGMANYADTLPSGALQGLKVVTVAVVSQAVWGMARNLCPDAPRITLMAAATCLVLLVPSVWGQMGVMACAAIIGMLLLKPQHHTTHDALPIVIPRRTGLLWLMLFFTLLLGLPLLSVTSQSQALSMVDAFYRSGALVFAGGHVVLPLLQAEVVPIGWVDNATFLAGYAAAQAIPGPLFTFSAFLGASMNEAPSGLLGALICLLAIFAPSFLLVVGVLPFWQRLRHNRPMQAALLGINAAVVGVLLAALYKPVWTSAIHGPQDFGLALMALIALMVWKIAPWLVVILSAVAGGLLNVAFYGS